MAVIFGPDAFTVGADQDINTYPTGSPDYAYSRGSGTTVNAANDRAQSGSGAATVPRCIDVAVSANMTVQEARGDLRRSVNTDGLPGLAVRYSASTSGYLSEYQTAAPATIFIKEDAGGTTVLASRAESVVIDTTYASSFRAVGGSEGTWLTLIVGSFTSLTIVDTTAIISGAPGLGLTGADGNSSIDNFLVDDLAGFPLVAGIVSTNGTTATTAPVVNLPSGILADETLLMLIRNAAGGTITFPNEGTDWIQLFEDGSDASNDTTALAWRKASGTEGATTTAAFGTSGKFAAIVYRVLGADNPSVRPPEFATLVTGSSTLPDPGTITPTGGAKNYLFIWMGGWEGEQTSPPASFPTNYNSPVGADSGVAGAIATNCRLASAHREVNASSENPGSWTISASDDWTATVVAVHPAQDLMGAMIM